MKMRECENLKLQCIGFDESAIATAGIFKEEHITNV